MSGPFYPPLSSLLPSVSDALSGTANGLTFLDSAGNAIDDLIAHLLEPLRYRDLTIELSHNHDLGLYRFTLLTDNPVKLNLPAGLTLVFFPDALPPGGSAVGITYIYEWPIKGYVRDFAIGGNPGKVAFDLFLHLAGITDKQLYERLLTALAPSQTDYAWLIVKLNAWRGDFPAQLTPTSGAEIEDILAALEDIDADAYTAAFEAVVQDGTAFDLDVIFDRLRQLFEDIVGQIDRSDVENLLLPQFRLTLESLKAAIDFPERVLRPLDGSPFSRLTFTAGALTYDTRTGFDVLVDETVGVTLTPSEIGKTGLTLQIDGCKLDLSPSYNIPEAVADMRPPDFMGVFFKSVTIGLPPKWFANHLPPGSPPATLAIVGRNLLMGTGGVSGEIGLEVLDVVTGKPQDKKTKNQGPDELEFILGNQPSNPNDARKGFKLGFSTFDMKLHQNALEGVKIKGSLTVPKFDPAPNKIDIELLLSNDGDFEVTASVNPAHKFHISQVFNFWASSLSVGKDGKRVHLRTTGDLDFSENPILMNLIKKPIHIEKLLIYSDGSMELEGGTIPLPESCSLKIGPAKIAITALHFGAHEQDYQGDYRKFRYFGFDGGVSINPGGVDARGDGIKYYYTVDDLPFKSFLRIDGIGIALVIPGSASEASAALILKGYLSLKNPVYQGSISFALPKAKIRGGGSMKYDTSYPAWIVDVNLELPKPLPLGSTSLGIYGFRGLFGLRYVASKSAIDPPLPEDASWGDYYRARQDIKGVTTKKFITPDKTGGSKNPFSVGVGAGLCTATDGGKLFSSQLFLLVSLPNLIMLEGRADILSKKRVAVEDDPPYYAYLALSPESIELGAGVNYLIPKDSGAILNLNAVMEAAFFFHNTSAWYVHFGTKAKPITARILSMFDGYSYLMLSASGMEVGAGVHFDFSKGYGPVQVAAHAYLDMWAYVAFERFQAGGGVALGGFVDVKLFKFGFHIELAATLTVEVPDPFYVAGSVEICVSVNLKVKKFEKCCHLEFKWEKSNSVNTSFVPIMTLPTESSAAVGVHMVSGSTYPVVFSDLDTAPNPPLIPIDCFIDVKFKKPVDPSAVATLIGGFTSPPTDNCQRMPPQYGSRVVEHAYALDAVAIDILDRFGVWRPYHPYKALAPEALRDSLVIAKLDAMPLGVWQFQDTTYSQIRFLAQTPFSWMADMRGYVPEEMGVTAKSTYCVAREREERCVQWTAPADYATNTDYKLGDILYRVDGDRVEALSLSHAGLAPVSLAIGPSGRASFRFLEPTMRCRLRLFTTAPTVTVHWQRRKPPAVNPGSGNAVVWPWALPEFEDIGAPLVVPRAALANPVVYDDATQAIERIVLETPVPDLATIASLEEQIALTSEDWIRGDALQRRNDDAKIAELRRQLQAEHDRTCIIDHDTSADDYAKQIAALQSQLDDLHKQIDAKQSTYNKFCVVPAARPAPVTIAPPAAEPSANAIAPVQPAPAPAALSEQPGCAGAIAAFIAWLTDLINQIIAVLTGRMSAADCRKLAAEIAALQDQARALTVRIEVVKQKAAEAAQAAKFPPGWDCGSFVHEICWLSAADYAFNQSIPSLAAIEADYTTMRDASRGVIAPVWQPLETFRITLIVSDKVSIPGSGSSSPSGTTVVSQVAQPYYVHFRTGGPIGYFDLAPSSDFLVAAPGIDDGRIEAPETALKFYIDMDRSTPAPAGKLLYAKPVYYHDVELRLFFNYPHAYHFFADWPGTAAGPRRYALELAVKDPAEVATAPPPDDYAAPFVTAPLLGTQSWDIDPAPGLAQEFEIIRAFQDPLAGGSEHATACLSIGGDPIAPLSKALKVEMHDLEPDKLYTAVILNRCLDPIKTAEVGRYPFKTSHHPTFAAHIASLKMKDEAQNERLAVFSFEHALGGDEAFVLGAALAMVQRAPMANTLGYADFFDRLIYGLLKLQPPPAAISLEFNFMTNSLSGLTYGLWVVSREPLFDPRLPESEMMSMLIVWEAGAARSDARVLFSKDRCQAFIMVLGGTFPTQNLKLEFTNKTWDGNSYVAETAFSEPFDKP